MISMREVVLPAAALTVGLVLAITAAAVELSPGPSPRAQGNHLTWWIGTTGLALIAIAITLIAGQES